MQSVESEVVEEIIERVDPGEMNSKFKLLRKIENKKFIYDSRDPDHSKREVLSSAWEEIATDIKLDGKEVTGDWCKKQWRVLRDYYYKLKRAKKGKSGQAATKTKPWVYFVALDRLLSSCEEENYSTTSNMDEVDSECGPTNSAQSSSNSISNDGWEVTNQTPSSSKESTPTGKEGPRAGSINKTRKRKLEDDEVTNKILELLEKPEELKDECYYFGMTTAAKLRRLPTRVQDCAMKNITDIIYDLLQEHT